VIVSVVSATSTSGRVPETVNVSTVSVSAPIAGVEIAREGQGTGWNEREAPHREGAVAVLGLDRGVRRGVPQREVVDPEQRVAARGNERRNGDTYMPHTETVPR
jgi:hypothetical protein